MLLRVISRSYDVVVTVRGGMDRNTVGYRYIPVGYGGESRGGYMRLASQIFFADSWTTTPPKFILEFRTDRPKTLRLRLRSNKYVPLISLKKDSYEVDFLLI